MAIPDTSGLSVAARVESISPHEVKLVGEKIGSSFAEYVPDKPDKTLLIVLKCYFLFFRWVQVSFCLRDSQGANIYQQTTILLSYNPSPLYLKLERNVLY